MKKHFELIFHLAAGLLVFSSNASAQMIRGVPGVDYPNYRSVPKTSFKCSEQKYIPGFYADLETDCQVFHFCYKHRSESFLCPIGTTFNQPILACDSWFNSNCSLASLFYVVNAGPGMRDAGRSIPMLLKLRERAQSSASVVPTDSAPEENPLEQKSEAIPSVERQNAVQGSIRIEDSSVDELQNQSQVLSGEDFETDVEHFDAHKVVEEELPIEESLGNENIPLDFIDNVGGFDQHNEQKENMVYDTVSKDDFIEKFHPDDTEWKDETEHTSEQFQDFYDSNDQMMQDPEYQHYQDEDDFESAEESAQFSFPENLSDDRSENEMEEFSKRLLQASHRPRRTRRKPMYVVLDKNPAIGHPMFQPASEISDATESPFTEPISMDTLVELNTELPDDYSIVKDEENYSEFDSPNNEELENFAALSREELEYLESERYYESLQENQHEDDQETQEYLESGRDLRKYQTDNFADRNELELTDDAENDGSDSEDDIFIYDDTVNAQAPDLDSEDVKADSGLVFIPDETDFPSSEITTEFSAGIEESEDGSENTAELNEDPDESDEDLYIYDDIPENQQGYGYEGVQGESSEQGYYDPQMQGNYESYAASEGMPQSEYDVTGQPEDYSQYQGQDFNVDQYGRYAPRGYYQYVDEYGRPLGPEFGNPEIHQMPEDSSFVNSDISGQLSDSQPDDIYQHGVFGDSYPYNQPDHANQYAYNPEFGYFQSSDGRFYTSDGEEIPPSMIPGHVESADFNEQSEEEMGYEGYEGQPYSSSEGYEGPDSANEFEYSSQEEGESEYIEQNDSIDSEVESDDVVENQDDEVLYVTESGLVEKTEDDQKKETFFVIDEAESSSNKFEELQESGYPESNGEEPFEGVVEDLALNKENQSKSVQQGNHTESGIEASSTTEEKDEPVPEQAEKNVGRKSEKTWPGQPFGIDAMNLSPASTPQLLNTFNTANFPSSNDFVAPSETQFLNNMGFQNPMEFGPYGFGPNMGQQLGMLDSSNAAPFSKGKGQKKPVKSDKPKLSKQSFQERVKSMKRGKFGMFKKYMNSMKNE